MKSMQGATLAASLLLLFVITLLGVSTIQTSQMQEKMSANLQDKVRSFVAAESGLAAGEAWINTLSAIPVPTTLCQAFPCVQEPYLNVNFENQDHAWWVSHSAAYAGNLSNINTPPRYLIEYIQFVSDSPVIGGNQQNSAGVHYFRVTARGTGSTNNAVTVLQTTVARRF